MEVFVYPLDPKHTKPLEIINPDILDDALWYEELSELLSLDMYAESDMNDDERLQVMEHTKKFPGIYLEIHTQYDGWIGEDDIEILFFSEGKMYSDYVEMKYPEFNKDKLIEGEKFYGSIN